MFENEPNSTFTLYFEKEIWLRPIPWYLLVYKYDFEVVYKYSVGIL